MQSRLGLAGAVALVLSACLTPTTHASSNADVQKSIQAAYDQQNAAAARKDVNEVYASLIPSFVATETNGKKFSIALMRQQLTELMAYAKSADGKTAIQKLMVSGIQATVTVQEHAAITLLNPQTQQPVTLVNNSESRDVWVKSGRSWLEKSSLILSEKQTLNGQSFPPRPSTGKGPRTR